ncbi:hypothetical protein JJQ59_04720 [Cupriavidus necator]|uniref:hypothetical protein n=1 Tax=Cupriavidus necator TaxID=106590 RepID=UPI0011BDB442|nr:hypothetical protein [Cupriavidus necator]QQX85251.1 hypothetical protein JJQ59_04720 [Cupriavidus necator]
MNGRAIILVQALALVMCPVHGEEILHIEKKGEKHLGWISKDSSGKTSGLFLTCNSQALPVKGAKIESTTEKCAGREERGPLIVQNAGAGDDLVTISPLFVLSTDKKAGTVTVVDDRNNTHVLEPSTYFPVALKERIFLLKKGDSVAVIANSKNIEQLRITAFAVVKANPVAGMEDPKGQKSPKEAKDQKDPKRQ